MDDVVISGTGFYLPPYLITNEELVESYNNYVESHNQKYAEAIRKGEKSPLEKSDTDFIINASGIKNRYTLNKDDILNINTMHPKFPKRNNEELSIQVEFGLFSAEKAMKKANKQPNDIDGVIIACSNIQRPYPAIAIELQEALKIEGFAFDLNAACSSATFAIYIAYQMILSGGARSILIVSPEMYPAHLNFRDRRSHFIFGSGSSAVVVEKCESCSTKTAYKILGGKLRSKFSNNIRNNFGFLCRDGIVEEEHLFTQNGKKVKEEVVPIASNHILNHLSEIKLTAKDIKRLWLHQANIHMNKSIANNVFGRMTTDNEAPTILEEYGNTGASSVIIAFNKYNEDLVSGNMGVLCSFGAGYTAGSIILKKL
jgi:beta-ketodecanoyl-[acyl-carrier-protein] synthase